MSHPSIFVTYRGKTYTLLALSRLLKVSRMTLWRWHRNGEVSDAAIAVFLRERELYARRRHLGISPKRVYARIHRFGWSEKAANETPLLPVGYSEARRLVKKTG
jgi:hypothetical protein